MPDISMCWGQSCPQRHNCYRYKAEPNEFRQSYFRLPPFKEDMTCDYYWPIEKDVVNSKSRIKRINAQLQARSGDIQARKGDSKGTQQDKQGSKS